MFRELLVGVALGIATSVVFEAVQMAGQVLSIQMGYSLINILDPNTQVDTTVVAMFQQSIAMLIFLRLDVHLWLLRAIGNSFSYLPPGSASLSKPFVTALVGAGSAILMHRRADRRSRAFRHVAHRRCTWPDGQGIPSASTHGAWSSDQESSRHGYPLCLSEVLARYVSQAFRRFHRLR